MEKIQKCSVKKHEKNDVSSFCQECKIYMCNKCESHHSELFQNHHQYKIDKNNQEIFTGFCKGENHSKLEFFCNDHNQLCCAACISKIKEKGYGEHMDCDICLIENIKEEKKNILEQNLKCLEEFSTTIDESLNQLKALYDKINNDKEEVKLKIQKIFTELRNEINKREDELLLEADNTFNILFFNEELVKKGAAMPKNIKFSLEKGKDINKEWNDNSKLSSLINTCINIETNINDICTIKENIEKANISVININFSPENIKEDDLLLKIQNFGKINFIQKMDKNKEYEILKKKYEKKEKKLKKELEKKENKKSEVNERLKKEEEEFNKLKTELEEFEQNKIKEIDKLESEIKEEENDKSISSDEEEDSNRSRRSRFSEDNDDNDSNDEREERD